MRPSSAFKIVQQLREEILRNRLIMAGFATLLLVAGCGKSGEEAKAPASGSTSGLKPDVANGAKIAGKVTFTGPKPDLRPIDMSANPACQKAHPSPVASEEVVVNNGSLANVFVWVKDGVPEGEVGCADDARGSGPAGLYL